MRKRVLSPKVEALYRAVMELVLEGREIRELKVSEITERAGIGKGTVYEYFDSREELLLSALRYLRREWAENLRGELSRLDGFMGKIGGLFDQTESALGKIKREALKEVYEIFFFSPAFQSEKCCGMAGQIYCIVDEGRRGGVLRKELPDEYIALALKGKIIDYALYCGGMGDCATGKCTSAQIRKYLLDSIRMEFLA